MSEACGFGLPLIHGYLEEESWEPGTAVTTRGDTSKESSSVVLKRCFERECPWRLEGKENCDLAKRLGVR
jgi:hypothetical protein